MNNSKIISKVLLSLSLFTVGASAFVIQDELMQKNHAKAEVSAEEIKKHEEKWNKYYGVNAFNLPKELFSKVDEKDRQKYPYNTIGNVFVKGQTSATGVLIGKNTVLTNRHIAKFANGDPSKVSFRPSINTDDNGNTETPYGEYEVKEILQEPFGAGVDLALIRLKPDQNGVSLGDKISPAKIGTSNDLKDGDKLELIGYPFDHKVNQMHRSEIELTTLSRGLRYYGFTVPGNSGSGIFNSNGELVGIHSSKVSHLDREHQINYGVGIGNYVKHIINEKNE
ncbi:TPA: exfoliative toxin A [Staphylococcus aureus]|nr:exfoliative toxin A [Staphylococcus aureus]